MNKVWEDFYKKRGRFFLLPHSEFGKVISKLRAFRAKKILDLGCGSGRHSIELAKAGFAPVGIDFSKQAIALACEWAKKENFEIDFQVGNIHKKLPFKESSFDAVIAIDSLCYDTTEALEFTLDESKRVLRKGGVLFITLPTQSGNPLVTHLVFSKREARAIVDKYFRIIDSFLDKQRYLCLFGIKKE